VSCLPDFQQREALSDRLRLLPAELARLEAR
jgi:hypothetical protein